MSRITCALLVLVLMGIAGCGSRDREGVEQQPPAAAEEPVPQKDSVQAEQKAEPQVAKPSSVKTASPSKASSKPPSKAAEPAPVEKAVEVAEVAPQQEIDEPVRAVREDLEVPAAPQEPEPRFVSIPNGTPVQVRLLEPLDTSVNQSGESFRAILDQDLEADGIVVAPRGSILQGKLSNVTRSGRVEGRASMSLRLILITIGDQSYPIQTETLTYEAESTKKKDAAKVGIGAGIGAVVGAIAGGGKGAAIGAAVGSGAGGATVLATRGEELKFDKEHQLSFVLTRDLTLEVR